jgi:hypothetical protein
LLKQASQAFAAIELDPEDRSEGQRALLHLCEMPGFEPCGWGLWSTKGPGNTTLIEGAENFLNEKVLEYLLPANRELRTHTFGLARKQLPDFAADRSIGAEMKLKSN